MSSLMTVSVDVASLQKFKNSPTAYQESILLKLVENDSPVSMLFKGQDGGGQ